MYEISIYFIFILIECIKFSSSLYTSIINLIYQESLINECKNYYICIYNIKKLLISCDVNIVNRRGETALMIAVENIHHTYEVIKLLVDGECNCNIGDNDNIIPLMITCYCNHADINTIKLLIENSDCNLSDNYKETVLVYACISRNPNIEVIKILINDKNCKVNCQDEVLKTSLMCACSNKLITLDIIEFLLDKSDVKIKDSEGDNALMLACKYLPVTIQLLQLFMKYYEYDEFVNNLPEDFKNKYLDDITEFYSNTYI